MDNNESFSILEGIVSISAAVKSGKREIYEVYADKNKVLKRDRKATRFISFLKEHGVSYTLKDRQEIDEFVNTFQECGTSHGGFVACVGVRSFTSFTDFLTDLKKTESYAVFLDGVEDPFNFGYSLRSLHAFNTYGFIVPERNWMSSANVVARSSAGASELCNITVAPNDDTAFRLIKESRIKIVCAGLSKDSVPLYDFKCNEPFILFIGGEKRGISHLFFENADKVVHIPYTNSDVSYSLPTASVASIFGAHLANN